MPERQLTARMLGGFSLHYGGREIVLDRNSVSKTNQLLQMVLLHTADGIAKTSLIDGLYGREEVENKNGSLNNTLFRLRRQLKEAGLPQGSYITVQNGICRWDSSIPVEVDCCAFEHAVLEGRKETEQEARIAALTEACRLYRGEFLPTMIGEDWVAVQNVYYKELYFSCLEELCRTLKEKERFEDIYELTTAAADIYPFDHWQEQRIDSLIAMARYREAMDVYRDATRLFFDELGLPPSPKMLERFRFMSERISQSSGVIEDIKAGLTEREKMRGAYYCTFPSFVDIYHVISRMMERNGTSVYIMLCTLRDKKGPVITENEKTKEVSVSLMEDIRLVLRRGDFYTKYNIGQYLIMLSGINQENCSKVSARIEGAFQKQIKKNEYQLDFYVASVAEIGPDLTAPAVRSFRDAENIWKK